VGEQILLYSLLRSTLGDLNGLDIGKCLSSYHL
jgi:hypothetical protein